jgi:uncharacterized protein YndB with AHSA1/START domain
MRSSGRVWALGWLFALLVLSPLRAVAALPEGVQETSFTTPRGERVMELSIDVPAGAGEVWDAWATAEGFKSWAVPFAVIDFRVGGSIESAYNPAAKPGDPDNIRNEIVAALPMRMFVLRNVQAPAKLPFDAATFQKTQTVVTLTPLGEKSTRVTVANSGYESGSAWDGVYHFFREGNAYSLSELRKRFVTGPTDWAKAFAPPAKKKP